MIAARLVLDVKVLWSSIISVPNMLFVIPQPVSMSQDEINLRIFTYPLGCNNIMMFLVLEGWGITHDRYFVEKFSFAKVV